MKRLLVIGAIIILVMIAVAIYLAYALRQPHSGAVDNLVNPFDFASSTAPISQNGELQIGLSNGGSLFVPDFTQDDQPDIAGPETGYQVGGTVEERFQTLYFPDQSYFLISLQSEPLGEVRLAAESELRQRLELTNAELCALNLEVRTSAEINEAYAGSDLGLSFCPEAVPLP